jgi:murein DD-endopeptidase MepM/ murein hydrolase activator NlpD
MPGGGDRTRRVGGSTARFLPEPGEAIIRNPEVIEEVPADPVDGVLSPPPVVDTTRTADGTTPRQEREAAQALAESIIDSSSDEEGPDGRSPDPRRTADEAGTGGSSRSPEESDARRSSSDITASREADPVVRSGSAPHFFTERVHQAYYHDAIVYIEGENVSQFLTGTVSFSYGFGTDYNKCDFTLDNAGHRFTLTPENLQGQFRTASPFGSGDAFDYDETVKYNMYSRKSREDYNPVDPDSGGRRFPLHLWSSIFHKHDAVRVWIHNPVSELDEWIPVFAGFVISKPVNENYIDGLNTISVSCADIRLLMSKMRVNTNTMFAVLPGSQTTGAADPTDESPISGINVFRTYAEQGNRQFNTGFFADLVAGSTTFSNPWTSLNLPELIAALTFLPGTSSALIGQADARALRGVSAARSAAEQEVARAAAEFEPLHRRVQESGEASLSDTERRRYRQLLAELEGSGVTAESASSAARGDFSGDTSAELDEAEDPSAADPPPGADPGSTVDAGRTSRRVASERGAGRIGRMRPGVFPFFGSLFGDPPRPYASETYFPSSSRGRSRAVTDRQIQQRLRNWYSLCLFGTPVRHNFRPASGAGLLVEDAPPDHSPRNRRYWTEEEVHQAGRSTRREGAWHPEAQAVHFLSPGRNTPNDILWSELTVARQPVAQNLNWQTRLQLISDACDTADYRFWVSGCGDLIFEFAQYDFSPEDYGTWSEVLTLDHHLLNESFDEEGGEIVTAVLANGSFVALDDIDEGSITQLNPARSVGIWSPNLASRLGLNVKVLTFPQITDVSRLEQLATLEFQKYLAAADKYQVGLAFRPWLLPNKPIFNRYRERLALIDGVSWTLPVTAGQIAGQQVPTMNLTLNYTRSYDELGLPRYITGGPANPMYFAIPADPRRSVVQSLQQRVRDFEAAIRTIRTDGRALTAEEFQTLRDRYRAIIPNGQATYNVIDAAFSGAPDRPEGEEDPVVTELRALEAELDELTRSSGALTEEERSSRLESIRSRVEELEQNLRERGIDPSATHTTAGVRPRVGVTGVRSTLSPSEDIEPAEAPDAEEEPTCNPGDPRFFSAPTGPSVRTVPRWAAWRRSLPARERTGILDRYARGMIPDEEIDRGVGTWQFAGEFPRVVTSGFGLRGTGWHPGVDIPMDYDEPVYAVADGIVFYTHESVARNGRPGQGLSIGLMHANGFVTFYRHQNRFADGIELGATVKRNQIISYTGFSGTEQRETQTHLHFECGAIFGSDAFERYVGEGKQFRVVTASERSVTTSTSAGDSVERARTRGSMRVVSGIGDEFSEILRQWDPELVSRFNLGFLRRRDGSLGLGARLVLFYNPIPNSEPFSQAETVGRPGPDTDVLTLQEYYDQFGLKGIPALRMAAEPTRFAPEDVLEIPPGTSDRRRRRLEQERNAIIARNERLAARTAAYTTSRNQQVALFANEVPPNACPPERYEGDIPRQAGEPLPNRERLTRETAEAARRRSS